MFSTLKARRILSWALFVLALGLGVASVISWANGSSGATFGWGEMVTEIVFIAGPLVGVGVGLRSTERKVMKITAIVAGCLAVIVAFVLAMQLLDPNEIARDRLMQAIGVSAYAVACIVESRSLANSR